jgi:hypothetical protein
MGRGRSGHSCVKFIIVRNQSGPPDRYALGPSGRLADPLPAALPRPPPLPIPIDIPLPPVLRQKRYAVISGMQGPIATHIGPPPDVQPPLADDHIDLSELDAIAVQTSV